VDTAFQKSRVLDVRLSPAMLEPAKLLDVEIVFTPRAAEV
jgi:hypothetical protein